MEVSRQMEVSRETQKSNLEEKSSRCKGIYLMFMDPLSPDAIAKATEEDRVRLQDYKSKGFRRHHVAVPVSRLQGPYTQQADIAGISHRIGLKFDWLA